MKIEGWYYLHENKDLIYKPYYDDAVIDFRDSDFVKAFWSIDPTSRMNGWQILVEASVAGARHDRIKQLAETWRCDDNDGRVYADKIGVHLSMDGDKWHATKYDYVNPMESPEGFGETVLEAMSELCKALGFSPSKLNWHSNFHQLVGFKE